MDRTHALSITRQAQLPGISRADVYYKPVAYPPGRMPLLPLPA